MEAYYDVSMHIQRFTGPGAGDKANEEDIDCHQVPRTTMSRVFVLAFQFFSLINFQTRLGNLKEHLGF